MSLEEEEEEEEEKELEELLLDIVDERALESLIGVSGRWWSSCIKKIWLKQMDIKFVKVCTGNLGVSKPYWLNITPVCISGSGTN